MTEGYEEYHEEAADTRRRNFLRALALGAVLPGAAEALEPVPSCADLPKGDAGGYDCVLKGRDGARLLFDYTDHGDSLSLIFTEIGAEGDVLFRSGPVPVGLTPTGPALRDLDGDGAAELVIPHSADGVTVQNYVWQKEGQTWRRVAEIDGTGADALDAVFRAKTAPEGVGK